MRFQSEPVSSAVSRARVEKPCSTRMTAASASARGSSWPAAGPYHSACDQAARTAGSPKKPGATTRPFATASASHSS